MRLPKNLASGNYTKPDVILCQTNKEKICKLDTNELKGNFKFSGYSEISFNVPSIYCDPITGEQKSTPYYNYIEGLRLVYLDGFGYFQLQDPETYSDGVQEYKSINAYSLEYTLSQKYLETFVINKGTTESIDGVVLHNPEDVNHSLLHLVLQKAYGWSIGHVDDILQKQGRSFEVDRESIYDFLMNELCETYKCYLEFDTINNTVNVYSDEEIVRIYADGESNSFHVDSGISMDDDAEVTVNGHVVTQWEYNASTRMLTLNTAPAKDDIIEITNEFKSKYDTDILIAFENLTDEMKVSYSADDIKTQLAVKGADDLDIRAVNFGLPSIINLDYYHTVEWMGESLYNEYTDYLDKQEKYMTGFYSKDVTSLSEESFIINANQETFGVGTENTINVDYATESFPVNGYSQTFNIDKSTETFDITINRQTEHEPDYATTPVPCTDPEIETIPVTPTEEFFIAERIEEESSDTTSESGDGTTPEGEGGDTPTLPEEIKIQNTFPLSDAFVFNNNTVIKVNDKELTNANDYSYDDTTRILTINKTLNEGDNIYVYSCPNEFNTTTSFSSLTKVTLNGTELTGEDYTYNSTNKVITINVTISKSSIIEIYTYKNQFQLGIKLNDKSKIYVNGTLCTNYIVSESGYILVINERLTSKDSVELKTTNSELITKFKLEYADDNILSVMINGNPTTYYRIEDGILYIDDESLTYGDTILITSGSNSFTLGFPKDEVVLVEIDGGPPLTKDKYQVSGNVVTITDVALYKGSVVTITSMNTKFKLTNNKSKISRVLLDGIPFDNYSFDSNNNILSIDAAYVDEEKELTVETLDNFFAPTQLRDKIAVVMVNGNDIESQYSYENGVLTIDEALLTIDSQVDILSIYTHFTIPSFEGDIETVAILDTKTAAYKETTEYRYENDTRTLYVDDDALTINNKVTVKTVYNTFKLTTTKNKILAVIVFYPDGREKEISNYTIDSTKTWLVLPESVLTYGCTVVIESSSNTFAVTKVSDNKYIVEQKDADTGKSETLSAEENEYTFDSNTGALTINKAMKPNDVITIKFIDSTSSLLVVDSNAGSGEILLSEVKPTLDSYTPKVGDYVVKVEGYESLLKKLYDLIDEKLDAENTIPQNYDKNVTEKKLSPENANSAESLLGDASIETLGDIYKIVSVDSNGTVLSTTYYVCEMKMKVVNSFNTYEYSWNKRNLIFGDEGVNFLKEQVDIYTTLCEVQISAGWGSNSSENYDYYLENYEKLDAAKKQLKLKEAEVQNIAQEIEEISAKIADISSTLDINNNFSVSNLERLLLFLREDEYTDDCFVVTDIDTNAEMLVTQKELLVAGQKELKKISRPTLSFTASLRNIYAMPEFEPILNQFELGKFIKIKLNNGFLKKSRLLEVDFNFEDLSDFSCEFGDLLMAKDPGDIHADLLKQAISAGKIVADSSSNWQKGFDMANSIDNKIRQGLIDATTSIKTDSAGQSISWDNYGIHLRRVIDGVLDPREGWITNNNFLYSSNNFKTTEAVFGEYKVNGTTYWGLLAKCVIAGLIQGSTIEGGTIKIGQQFSDDGLPILDEKTKEPVYNFEVTSDGEVKMSKGNAAEVLAYFSFDATAGGLIVGASGGDFFARLTPERIDFGIKSIIKSVNSIPTYDIRTTNEKNGNRDVYACYKSQVDGSSNTEPKYHYKYYKMPDYRVMVEEFDDKENPKEPEVYFGKVLTRFANDTAWMKEAEIENNLAVGVGGGTPNISLGKNNSGVTAAKLKIESDGSLSITTRA